VRDSLKAKCLREAILLWFIKKIGWIKESKTKREKQKKKKKKKKKKTS
jgi:hypothetical protein